MSTPVPNLPEIIEPARPRRLPVLLALVAAAGLMLLGLMSLGLTGSLVADLVAPIVEHLRGLPHGSLTTGPRAFATALLLSLTFPLALPFGLHYGLRLFNADLGPALVLTMMLTWAWSIVVLFAASFL